MRVDEYGNSEKPEYVTNLIVVKFTIIMEITSEDASWINGNNEQHNRIMHNMVIADLTKHRDIMDNI